MKTVYFIAALTLMACVPPQEGTSPADPTLNNGNGNNSGPNGVSIKQVGNGAAIDLMYQFTKGTTYSYTSVESVEMAMSTGAAMPGGMGINLPKSVMAGMNMKFRTETDFNLVINQVNEDKSASFSMNISKFRMYSMPSKTLVATGDDIASDGLSISGTITPKGAVTFNEDLYIVITESKKRYLVRATAGKNGSSASASDGETEVSVFAEYDPKTGAVVGGVKTKKKSKVPASIKLSSSAQKVEILPHQFMQYFALPEGKVISGSKTTMKAPMMNLSVVVSEAVNSVTNLAFNIETNTEGVGEMPEEAKASVPVMTGKVETKFNNTIGRLEGINGKIKMTMNAGVKMDITSTLNLTLNK